MANIEKRDNSIKGLLTGDEFKTQVERALPRHLKPERFIRIALTALTKTPKLQQCTSETFFASLLTLSELGLEPDGRRAHLIPYGRECKVIVDYKGLVELVMRGGNVSNIHADIVCENDVFEYDRGEIKTHKIDFRKPRGEPYAVYAICRFKDGTEKTEVMNREEVEAIRKRSKAGQSGPWVTDWNEMAKKTAFRRLSKWLPLSPEQREALEKDDDQFEPINVTYTETPPEKGVKALEAKLTAKPEPEPPPPAVDTPANAETEPAETPEPEQAGGRDVDEVVRGIVKVFSSKPTKTKGTRYGVMIKAVDDAEVWVNTFSKTVYEEAEALKGCLVEAGCWKNKYGLEIEYIKAVVEEGQGDGTGPI